MGKYNNNDRILSINEMKIDPKSKANTRSRAQEAEQEKKLRHQRNPFWPNIDKEKKKWLYFSSPPPISSFPPAKFVIIHWTLQESWAVKNNSSCLVLEFSHPSSKHLTWHWMTVCQLLSHSIIYCLWWEWGSSRPPARQTVFFLPSSPWPL